MHECNKLDEKDLQCITRTLQGAIFEDSLYYGCKYCQYSKECSERLHNEEGLYFDMVRKKLQGITGLYMGVCYDPANPDATFTKGTEKKNTQKKWTSAVFGKIVQKLKGIKIRFVYWNHYFHPFTHISAMHCYDAQGCYQNSYLYVIRGGIGSIQVLARVPYDKDKVWIRKGYEQGFIGELVTEEDRIERSRGSKI